jgi:hypothetical protein
LSSLREAPLRFILLLIFLGAFDRYLLKALRKLSRDNSLMLAGYFRVKALTQLLVMHKVMLHG